MAELRQDLRRPSEPPLCKCGCGQPVLLATRTRADRGTVKGEYLNYLPKHNLKNFLVPPPEEYTGPPVYCQCGCGKLTPIVMHTRSDREQVRGQPAKYLSGHYLRPDRKKEVSKTKKVKLPKPKQTEEKLSIVSKISEIIKNDFIFPFENNYQLSCIGCGKTLIQNRKAVIYQPRCQSCITKIVEEKKHSQNGSHVCEWCDKKAIAHSGTVLKTVLWACLEHWDNLRISMRSFGEENIKIKTARLIQKISAEY